LPTPPTTDNYLEQQAIVIVSGETEITLVNIYIPPVSSCEGGYNASIKHLLHLKDCLIAGDINGHNELWHSEISAYSRGDSLAEEFDDSDFGVLNEPLPTISLWPQTIFR
jgi:hypothetical protein